MDDNSFLKNYKKKTGEQKEEPQQAAPPGASVPVPAPAPAAMHYEEKSGFVRSRRDYGAPSGPRRSSPLGPAILIAVVVIGIAAGLIWYFNRGVQLADLAGWTLNDAQLWASDNGVNLQIDEQYNDKVDTGKVAAQDPPKGTTVKKNSFVRLTVSKGHDLTVSLPLPDLMSMTGDEVQAWADENFMAKVYITTAFSGSVPSGKVISFQINDSTVVDKVTRNTPIYVTVSKGSEDQSAASITIPDFKTETVAECYSFANENGLVLEIVEQYDDYTPKGAVISQSVKADEKARKGDKITLIVSKGKKVLMPNFSSSTKAKATATAQELGIPLATVDKYSGKPAGGFISQSIPAGTVYDGVDVLELDYSLGNKVVVASFVGQTEDAIETWAKGLNDQGAAITIRVTKTQNESPKGTILYQDKANMEIGIKTSIRITVSLGLAVFVPDFIAPAGSGYDVAITRDEAMAMCKDAGLVPVFVASKKSGKLPGEVWYQSVAAGREVYQGSTITLKYNPDNVQVAVPDFTGKTEAELAAYNNILSITVVVSDTHVDGYDDTVWKQSVEAGTTVASGSPITVYISPLPPSP